MADKRGRVQNVIQKDLSEIIIYDIKDEITSFASINEVKMTPDYSYCKVFVSHINAAKTDELVAFLNKRAPKIRSLLAQKLSIWKTPELTFVADKLFEQGQEMEDLIEHAINKKPKTLADVYPDLKKKEAKKAPAKKTATKKTTTKKTATKKTATAKKTTTKKTTKKAVVSEEN